MLKNIYYDMMEEMAALSKSIYRMDTYMKDAKECGSCKQLWQKMKQRQEEELSMLMDEFKTHVKEEKV